MSVEGILLLSCPYVVAALIAGTGLPNRLMTWRYKTYVSQGELLFARRWHSAAEIVSMPLVSLFYFLGGALMRLNSTDIYSPSLTALVLICAFVYTAYVIVAYWVLTTTILDIGQQRTKYWTYDNLVRWTKVIGVLLPGAYNIMLAIVAT